jgi:DNA polymerase/3'-5' exonuclease PolX
LLSNISIIQNIDNMDHTKAILQHLDKLRMKSVSEKEVFKARAYVKAINGINDLGKPIQTVEDVNSVPGVGAKIKEKIKTIIETGHLTQTDTIDTELQDAMADLMRVHGIGPAKAKDLVQNHGVKSTNDLLSGTGSATLTHAQALGLKYLADFEKRIPRKEMERHERYFAEVLEEAGVDFKIVGSYRRGGLSSGDIDVLIRSADAHLLDGVIKRMVKEKYIVDVMAQGAFKFMGVSRVKWGRTHRRLDILVTPDHEYPFAILYFTGDAEFNKKLRAWVLSERKMSLSEHGLKDQNSREMIDTGAKNERQVFEYLGIEYVAPQDRSVRTPIVPRA